MSGSYYWTLNATDVNTYWNLSVLLEGKTQEHVISDLEKMIKYIPYRIKGIDSDNGSEFINQLVVDFCSKNKIHFTRCRPYKKNDNCFVEQKNYSVVRRNVGYLRYDNQNEFEIINQVYSQLHIYNNFFQPVKILESKTRIGSKYFRKYRGAKTPFQRLIESSKLTKREKSQINNVYEQLNPAELKRNINKYQSSLIEITRNKQNYIKKTLDKSDKYSLARFRKRNKPAKINPSIFVENQEMDKLREIVKILDDLRK
ncbi:MAG: transposase family protein [Spirochaetes bacterium]|nr:transposase family protein [Spirochaetota bacterium]